MSDAAVSALAGPSALAGHAASSAMGGGSAVPNDAKRIRETAQKFEAIFIRQMLAEARKTNMGDQLFGGQGGDTFREMQEQTFAKLASEHGGFGFARMIEQRLGAALARHHASADPLAADAGGAATAQPVKEG